MITVTTISGLTSSCPRTHRQHAVDRYCQTALHCNVNPATYLSPTGYFMCIFHSLHQSCITYITWDCFTAFNCKDNWERSAFYWWNHFVQNIDFKTDFFNVYCFILLTIYVQSTRKKLDLSYQKELLELLRYKNIFVKYFSIKFYISLLNNTKSSHRPTFSVLFTLYMLCVLCSENIIFIY